MAGVATTVDGLLPLVDAVRIVLGVHGAGVSVVREGFLSVAAGGSGAVSELGRAQERTQAGPSLDAAATGAPVLVTDMRDAIYRWPALARVVAGVGSTAMMSVPSRLELEEDATAVLDVCAAGPHTWTGEEVRLASLFAAAAGASIANGSRVEQATRTAEQLRHALDSRVLIEQAKGILSAERGISVDDAFALLRRRARDHGEPLRDVADPVVNRRLRP